MQEEENEYKNNGGDEAKKTNHVGKTGQRSTTNTFSQLANPLVQMRNTILIALLFVPFHRMQHYPWHLAPLICQGIMRILSIWKFGTVSLFLIILHYYCHHWLYDWLNTVNSEQLFEIVQFRLFSNIKSESDANGECAMPDTMHTAHCTHICSCQNNRILAKRRYDMIFSNHSETPTKKDKFVCLFLFFFHWWYVIVRATAATGHFHMTTKNWKNWKKKWELKSFPESLWWNDIHRR